MFDRLEALPPDAIIALMQQCQADDRPDKIDLGVGVYKDSAGNIPIMQAVKMAETQIVADEKTKTYVGTTGRVTYREYMLSLVLGAEHPALQAGRIASTQAAGGSGALRIGAQLAFTAAPDASVWVSTPTWANHIPLIGSAGFAMKSYPYYNRDTLGVDFEDMLTHLEDHAKAGDIIVLHGCCHNPTGADLTPAQWDRLIPFLNKRGLLPFIDLAYLGLGHGLEKDAYGVRLAMRDCPEALIAVSCSKNFGLYKERVGLLAVLCETPDQTQIAQSQLGMIQRTLISMPPDHGAKIVERILGDPELRRIWSEELTVMRERMRGLRHQLSDALDVQGGEHIARAVIDQNGMFSTLPVTQDQAITLREDHAIYMTNSGRINIAGANGDNIPTLATALLDVLS
ncbi:aromatic amino acid transaminase [Algimonas porphyrae]|uniref:Aminotransferase n=1 Tax=Algimonas porphyrae TaxID=1128113 RepID=A0ABQ5V0U1_9PROT|nr:amino acid aminotransferase [Algimonas porphyrae]GLQ20697.1 aminotransferase [Algimonas porphyrae]